MKLFYLIWSMALSHRWKSRTSINWTKLKWTLNNLKCLKNSSDIWSNFLFTWTIRNELVPGIYLLYHIIKNDIIFQVKTKSLIGLRLAILTDTFIWRKLKLELNAGTSFLLGPELVEGKNFDDEWLVCPESGFKLVFSVFIINNFQYLVSWILYSLWYFLFQTLELHLCWAAP